MISGVKALVLANHVVLNMCSVARAQSAFGPFKF